MSILENLKAEQLQARKNRDTVAVNLLTTLIGDAVMVGKNNGNRESTDLEVVATIKKFITNTQETLNILIPKGAAMLAHAGVVTDDFRNQVTVTETELEILNKFLPPQLTEEKLSSVIDEFIVSTGATSIKDMGKVMKVLKGVYEGSYDGTLASKLIKERLA